jgi:hydroxymethylpyrimidine pyrophosphatase-like HAD family hydrolase
VAFGDNHNDIEMINYAGLGVAVNNATDSIKQAADIITDSNLDDGVANVVERLMLN